MSFIICNLSLFLSVCISSGRYRWWYFDSSFDSARCWANNLIWCTSYEIECCEELVEDTRIQPPILSRLEGLGRRGGVKVARSHSVGMHSSSFVNFFTKVGNTRNVDRRLMRTMPWQRVKEKAVARTALARVHFFSSSCTTCPSSHRYLIHIFEMKKAPVCILRINAECERAGVILTILPKIFHHCGRCTERFNVWWLALPMTYFRLHEQRLLRLSKHVLRNHKWVVWTRRLMQNFPFFNESSTKRQCRAKSQNRMSLVYTVDFAQERNDLWGHVLCSWKAHFKR